jgi:hypothetical protein
MQRDQYSFTSTFSDGTPDHTSSQRPGFRFADTNHSARLAADRAYEARRRRLENGWRSKGTPQQHGNKDARAAPLNLELTLDEVRAAANAAREARDARLRNAWKTRR